MASSAWSRGLLLAAGVSLGLAGPIARAADAPPAPPPIPGVTAELPHPPPKVDGAPRLAVHAYDVDGAPALAGILDAAAEEQLTGDHRFSLVPFNALLDDPADVIAKALGRADLAVVDADAAFGQMELPKARDLLTEAIETYARYLPKLAVRGGGIEPLRDAWIKLSKVRFFDGDFEGAKDALRYVFALDPSFKFNPKVFPVQMKKLVVEARLLFDALGNGPVIVDSEPPGAIVYINGKRVEGTTPTAPVEAPAGPLYLSFERRNYAPMTAIANHEGADTQTVVQSLQRYPKNPIAPINRGRKELGESDRPPSLKEGADLLGVELLLLFRATKVEEGDAQKLRLTAALYDARLGKVLKRAERTINGKVEEEARSTASFLAKEVTSNVRLDGVDAPLVAEKSEGGWSRFSKKTHDDFERFYRWKGFWYVVGASAALLIGGVVGTTAIAVHEHRVKQEIVLLGVQ